MTFGDAKSILDTIAVGAKRMQLSPAEQALIATHRAKTAGDREFNAGLDHALEVVRAELPDDSVVSEIITKRIANAKREV